MSDPEGRDGPPEPLDILSSDVRPDPGTFILSDSDPELSDEAEVASISPEEDEEEEQETGCESHKKSPVLPFTLKGTDASFSQRSQGIFGGLLELPVSASPTQSIGKTICHIPISSKEKDTLETPKLSSPSEQGNLLRAVESSSPNAGTAAPSLLHVGTKKIPVPAARLPDYVAHPERWTKYSLIDVPESNDRTNRSTALKFMADLQKQRESKNVPPDVCSLSYNQDASSSGEGRILFTRPHKESQGSSGKSESTPGQLFSSEVWEDERQEETELTREQVETGTLGFHASKKRSRKNIRAKADQGGEDDSL
ncbi:U5 small nuclear ribonucleoprotein TSSC4 isoform 1-T4 [Rhinophrynus dorsalis]